MQAPRSSIVLLAVADSCLRLSVVTFLSRWIMENILRSHKALCRRQDWRELLQKRHTSAAPCWAGTVAPCWAGTVNAGRRCSDYETDWPSYEHAERSAGMRKQALGCRCRHLLNDKMSKADPAGWMINGNSMSSQPALQGADQSGQHQP